MRAVVQRVSQAKVRVDGLVIGEISRGLLVFLGVSHSDDVALAQRLADKVIGLRIFEDESGKMNLDVKDAGGGVLCVSQFTLYADVRRGRRPSFENAARSELAEPVYRAFCAAVEQLGVRCANGKFGAHMEVAILNDGPVTILVDSADLERPRRT